MILKYTQKLLILSKAKLGFEFSSDSKLSIYLQNKRKQEREKSYENAFSTTHTDSEFDCPGKLNRRSHVNYID